ncbi:hypothetical protein MKX03_008363 [Papaver bracteatum]|nr:hypothetical protein MKX03_008363 [Papaver bracteatum]
MKFTSLSNSVPVFLISLLIFSLYANKCDATLWPLIKAIEIPLLPLQAPPKFWVKEEFGDSKSMKYSSCAIYLQPTCILYLAKKYCRITMLEIEKGEDYAAMITKNCEEMLTNSKRYSETAKASLKKFLEAFNGRTLASGSSIHVTVSTSNSVTLAFTENASTPKQGDVTLDCKEVGEAFLMSTISLHTTIRESMGSRISDLFKSDLSKFRFGVGKNLNLGINLGTGKTLFNLDDKQT